MPYVPGLWALSQAWVARSDFDEWFADKVESCPVCMRGKRQ